MSRPFTHMYSDPHYGHKNIIGFCDRPFKDVEEMNEGLVLRFNEMVAPEHTTLFVGDCTMGIRLSQFKEKVMARLNGRKVLVRGNHDPNYTKCLAMGFDFVADRLWLDLDGTPAVVSHYPPKGAKDTHRDLDSRYWDRRPDLQPGVVYIHGHTHENSATFPGERRIHVGVDAWDYAPVSIEEVIKLAHKMVKPK